MSPTLGRQAAVERIAGAARRRLLSRGYTVAALAAAAFAAVIEFVA